VKHEAGRMTGGHTAQARLWPSLGHRFSGTIFAVRRGSGRRWPICNLERGSVAAVQSYYLVFCTTAVPVVVVVMVVVVAISKGMDLRTWKYMSPGTWYGSSDRFFGAT
jgi:hypothetical protein